MKCQECGENEATIHYIEIVEGQKTSQWICNVCAEKEGITPADVSKLSHGGLEAFLGGMLSSTPPERTSAKTATQPVCDVCGYGYNQLQKKGLLGCPSCYRAFRRQLLPMLRRYHGDVHHYGKLPRSHGPRTALRKEIARLKMMLEQAVLREAYEEAALMRDEIHAKEHEIEGLGRPEAESEQAAANAGESGAGPSGVDSDDVPGSDSSGTGPGAPDSQE